MLVQTCDRAIRGNIGAAALGEDIRSTLDEEEGVVVAGERVGVRERLGQADGVAAGEFEELDRVLVLEKNVSMRPQ